MPTIVGEWTGSIEMSCNDGDCQTEQNDAYFEYMNKLFNAQTWVYEHGTGWVYWSWKLSYDSAWSYQTALKQGWIKPNLDDKGSPCG
jgi:aryl-phospho-beta-D-glucosidase BglC (GH1 family)